MHGSSSGGGRLTRTALGRVGFIGELYDVRTEAFTSRSLFKSCFPENFIQTVHVTNTTFEYKFTENLSDRFDLLKVEAEMQVSLLCGLFEAEGCGKFLNDEKESEKMISCSLVCKFETICEKLFTSFEEILDYLDLTALEDSDDSTHVVVEVSWGANCCLDLKKKLDGKSEKKQIEGSLRTEIKKLVKFLEFKGEGEIDSAKSSLCESEDVRIKVNADVAPDGEIPTSVECFCQFLQKIPELLKKCNGGKGKPLSYAMIPLSHVRKVARLESSIEIAVQSIDESFLISIVCLFEEIASAKEKLGDFLKEMTDYQNYLADEEISEAKNRLEALRIRESRLKSIVAEDWVSVKSGRAHLKEMIRRVEKFKSRDLNLFSFEEYLSSSVRIQKKIATVQNYLSHGVEYLEKGKLFSCELIKNPSFDFIVLLVSADFENADPALYQSTCYHFLTLALNKELPRARYVVVDLDFDGDKSRVCGNRNFFSKLGTANVKCLHFRGGKVLCSDLYRAHEAEKQMNFARLAEGSEMDRHREKPGKRAAVEMTCPGFESGLCSAEKLGWNCLRCKETLEYGFDNYFYCSCGRGWSESYEYRCSKESHGTSFVSAKTEFLVNELSILRSFKELNILVLGQSGVGKSTWINSITNYLSYDTLEVAKENGVICTIPIAFTAYDRETGEKEVIRIGGETGNGEVTETGESATQFCSTYTFLWQGIYVRLIDTPGIGDTRGIHKDKENMKNIIDHISHLKELHGICVLMKANDCRINAIFSYCLKELLIHMHKSIANNIVFCFTNARNSFYTPGQTSVLLERQLESLQMDKSLSLGPHNRFCLDNEAFLFLCTLQNPKIRHDESLVKSFAQSWEISLKESQRLFLTIKNFRPHSLHDTVSLFTARNRILSLSKPMAEISKTIQMNLTVIARRKQELVTTEKTLEELSKKLYVNEIHLVPTPLTRPRTVCTSSKCVEYHRIEGLDITEVEYKTHCHDSCYLQNVETKALNNALLIGCTAMKDGVCTVCGCSWRNHMHITFDQKRIEKQGINRRVESDIVKEKSDKEKMEEFVRILEEKIQKYKKEQEFIIEVSVKFGAFLRENAISVYNDSVADYLRYLIQEEESKPWKTENDENLLKNLRETLKHYEAEIGVLQKVVDQGGKQMGIPTVKEVRELEEKLYALEMFGADIKDNVEANRSGSSKTFSYAETPLGIPVRKNPVPKDRKERKRWWYFF